MRKLILGISLVVIIFIGYLIYSGINNGAEPAIETPAPSSQALSDKAYYLYNLNEFSIKETVYSGITANVDFSTYPSAETFKTRIIEGAKLGPNFAGHYTLVDWGCGTSCQVFAVIDAISGKITEYGFNSSYGLKFDLESNLLISNPPEELLKVVDPNFELYTEYYVLRDGKLSLIAKQAPFEKEAILCAQVITKTKNNYSGEIRDFLSPCSIPSGWSIVK